MKILHGFLILFAIGYASIGVYQYKKVLSESIHVIQNDLALDLATAQLLSAQKRIETLKAFGYADLKIVSNFEEIPTTKSQLSTLVALEIDGTHVGYVYDNPKNLTIIKFVLGSTYLAVLFFVLVVLVIGAVILPLLKYKLDVQNFINENSSDRRNSPRKIGPSDVVTTKIKSIIDSKIASEAENQRLSFEIKEQTLISTLAKQVAHDIRSPISALNLLIPGIAQDPSKQRFEIITQATRRIEQIAEDLLDRSRKTEVSRVLTSYEFEQLVLEKQLLLVALGRKTKIAPNFSNDFVFQLKMEKIDFERIISNLIDNALEAIQEDESGLVEIRLSGTESSTTLIIKDNGVGIPKDVLEKLGTRIISAGKVNGNGLGIYHAKTSVESIGGSIQIESTINRGTTITVNI